MEPEPSFRRLAQEQQAQHELQAAQVQAKLEFRTPEELIRHDAKQTPLPDRLGRRVRDSVDREGASQRPWWRRWLGW